MPWSFILAFIPISIMFKITFCDDNNLKKTIFVASLVSIHQILQTNEQAARTSVFLMKVIGVQILMFGIVSLLKKWFVQIFISWLNQEKKKNNQEKQRSYEISQKQKQQISQKFTFFFILIILLTTSTIGLIISLHKQHHLQLYKLPQLPIMLSIVVVGFIQVAILDSIIQKYTQNSKKSSIRRKTFHIIPILLIPVLVKIDYKIFTLMGIGSFYLFWMAEVFRYFSKLARNGDVSMQFWDGMGDKSNIGTLIIRNPKKQSQNQYYITCNKNTSKLLILKTFLHLNNLNTKLPQLTLYNWMQQLNSQRQPYFWFTHLSLILGTILTYLMYPNHVHVEYQPVSLMLIMADAVAAIVGKRYSVRNGGDQRRGNRVIGYTGGKTLYGYFGFVGTALVLQVLWGVGVEADIWNIQKIIFMTVSSLICGAAQLYSGDLDNIVTGFVFIGVQRQWAKIMKVI